MVTTKAKTTAAPAEEPKCANCKWSLPINMSERVMCQVDLPPMILQSADPKRHTVFKNYRCIFHTRRD